jgi:hypothetical protein
MPIQAFPSQTRTTAPRQDRKGAVARAPLSRQARLRLRRQAVAATGIGLVAVTMVALSLSHLAQGIELVTASPSWEAWAMAIGIDLGFVGLELAQLSAASEVVRREITRFARPAIIGTLVGSDGMNAFVFAAPAQGLMVGPAVVLGIAVPAMIYALTRVAAAMYADCHGRG